MSLLRKLRSVRALAALTLAALLAGCGGSGNSGSPFGVNPLTNPDVVFLGSGRATDASWHFYAMNPDGSGVTLVPALNSLNARLSRSVVVNQNATFADFGINSAAGVEHRLVRLSNGETLFSVTTTGIDPPTVFAATEGGGLVAIAGKPTPADPYAIYTIAPDGTHKTQIAALPANTRVSEMIFAPNSGTLYFVVIGLTVDTPPPGSLYKLTLDASAPTLLANLSGPISSLHTSRDGTKLAFVSVGQSPVLTGATITPYTLNADGSGLAPGTAIPINETFNSSDAAIASRADGFHVLYVATTKGFKQIFDVRPDGTGRKLITSTPADHGLPASR